MNNNKDNAEFYPKQLVGGEVEAGHALLVLDGQLIIDAVQSSPSTWTSRLVMMKVWYTQPTMVCHVLSRWVNPFNLMFFSSKTDPKILVLVDLEQRDGSVEHKHHENLISANIEHKHRVNLISPDIELSPHIRLFHSSSTSWL